MSDLFKFNATAVGGRLTEDEFFGALEGVFRYVPQPDRVVVSKGLVDGARADVEMLEEAALRLEEQLARLPRWRWRRRHVLRRRLGRTVRSADGVSRTFGRFPA